MSLKYNNTNKDKNRRLLGYSNDLESSQSDYSNNSKSATIRIFENSKEKYVFEYQVSKCMHNESFSSHWRYSLASIWHQCYYLNQRDFSAAVKYKHNLLFVRSFIFQDAFQIVVGLMVALVYVAISLVSMVVGVLGEFETIFSNFFFVTIDISLSGFPAHISIMKFPSNAVRL